MNHNTIIIVAISIGITLLLLVYSTRIFIKSNDPSVTVSNTRVDLSEIEALLKQVLSKSHGVTEALESRPTATTAETQSGAELVAEIKRLQTELQQKQEEIEASKSKFKELDPEEKLKLEGRIRELEAKLAEYEIIAEDIADLSRYKDENIRLKKKISELESLTQHSSSIGNATTQTEVSSARASENADVTSKLQNQDLNVKDDIVSQHKIEGKPESLDQSVDSNDSSQGAISDDLMAEFARAVEEQKKKESKIFKSQEKLSVDLDSIQNEASALKDPPGDAEVVNPLEQELNADKLVAEASALEQVRPEDIELMNNFEEFVKGR